jgi:hypothetical protein
VAKPAALGSAWPESEARWVVYGYGCTQAGTSDGQGTKRRKVFTMAQPDGNLTDTLCPGDSGGPLMMSSTAELFGINSGILDGKNHFGDVPLHRAEILALAE